MRFDESAGLMSLRIELIRPGTRSTGFSFRGVFYRLALHSVKVKKAPVDQAKDKVIILDRGVKT